MLRLQLSSEATCCYRSWEFLDFFCPLNLKVLAEMLRVLQVSITLIATGFRAQEESEPRSTQVSLLRLSSRM